MPNPLLTAALGTSVLVAAGMAHAANDSELHALAERIRVLEAQTRELQQQAQAAIAAAQSAQQALDDLKASQAGEIEPAAETITAAAPVAAANAFNPAISLILNGTYSHHSMDPDAYQRAGFPLAGEAGPGGRGFALGESELSFAANIDDKFYGQLSLAVESEDGETELGLEEAYLETTALGHGLTARAGRFFSNVGYLNGHHAHTDFFSARPLAYEAFLGNQYGDDGVQLRWLAPTDFFLEFGGEAFRGDAYPAANAADHGAGVKTFFAHAGGDIGVEHAWMAGASILHSRAEAAEDGFSGTGNLYLFDLTWKWAPAGAFKDAGIVLRGEYLLDRRDGSVLDPDLETGVPEAWEGHRRGAYLEGIYRFRRRWDAGYRYDRLWAARQGPYASEFDPYRHSAMLTWHNSEFSLLRAQYAHDRPLPDFTDHVFSLQYQMSLGAHGAHKF